MQVKVKDLTIDELKALIRETVLELLDEIVSDPDEGLTVKDELKKELLEIRKRREAGVRGLSPEAVMQTLDFCIL